MRTNLRWSLTLALLGIATLMLNGYTINPKAEIHEGMTRAAKHCFDLALSSGVKPEGCKHKLTSEEASRVEMHWLRNSSLPFYNLFGWFKRWTGMEARYPNLEEAVRWPDDPTRQIGLGPIFKFGYNMLSECRANSADGIDVNDGLLCNSHYGTMQFWHSQASSVDESPVSTHDKITEWASFLFKVASGHLTDSELDTEYCDYFAGDGPFNSAMLPDQRAIPCEDTVDPTWTLTTLFTLKCSNPLQSRSCNEEMGSSRHDKARISATGALLHLIQDSYSQSHSERGQCTFGPDEKVNPVVACVPITMFTTYNGQENHSDADRQPQFADSCTSNGAIDDPITASAKALWHIHNGSDIEAFEEDLARVFSSRETIRANATPSSLGACFGDA